MLELPTSQVRLKYATNSVTIVPGYICSSDGTGRRGVTHTCTKRIHSYKHPTFF